LAATPGSLILPDADLDLARAAPRGFAYAGQSCISVQRIFVHDDVAGEFERRLVVAGQAQISGDPLAEEVSVGPMISEGEAARAESWVSEAVAAGARRLLGGERHGAMLPPTILAGVEASLRVVCREVFAPVVVLASVASARGGIDRLADSSADSRRGLHRDLEVVLSAFRDVDVGALVVNDVPTFRLDPMPYGGVRGSGVGRGGSAPSTRDDRAASPAPEPSGADRSHERRCVPPAPSVLRNPMLVKSLRLTACRSRRILPTDRAE
jgi:glyceraldehyde-3-phosphate dehydrogenase (NADP+)